MHEIDFELSPHSHVNKNSFTFLLAPTLQLPVLPTFCSTGTPLQVCFMCRLFHTLSFTGTQITSKAQHSEFNFVAVDLNKLLTMTNLLVVVIPRIIVYIIHNFHYDEEGTGGSSVVS